MVGGHSDCERGSKSCWRALVPLDVAARRAGGRRRYNAGRWREREARRDLLATLIRATWPRATTRRGWQTRAAREFGVSRATICRDVGVLLAEVLEGAPTGFNAAYIRADLYSVLVPTREDLRLRERIFGPAQERASDVTGS